MSAGRALHVPRNPPSVVRTYKRKNTTKKWPEIAKPPLRTRHWRHYSTNVCLLDARLPASTGHADAAKAVASLAFAHVHADVDTWQPSDVEHIIGIGNELHRRSLHTAGAPIATALRPPSVLNNFFVGDSRKVQTMVSAPQQLGPNADLLAAIRSCVELGYAGCIIEYGNRHRYLAVWQRKRCVYVFYPEKNWCLSVTADGAFQQLQSQLWRSQRMRLFAMKILQVQQMSHCPTERDEANVVLRQTDTQMFEPDTNANRADGDGSERRPIELKVNLHQLMTTKDHSINEFLDSIRPNLVELQPAFVQLPGGNVHILRASRYLDAGERTAATNVAAIAMLCIARSFTWTTDTVDEVLLLGQQIHDAALAATSAPTGSGERMQAVELAECIQRIRIGRDRHYTVEAEHSLFGELLSVGELPDLLRALQLFFEGAGEQDAAIVQGPQTVAVWHELGFYYMFDAKERDRFGRKWTSATASAAEATGCSCVTRFAELPALVALYADSVPVKHRHDAFRVVNVLVRPSHERSADWHQFSGTAIGRWILRGRCSQASARFAMDVRNRQAVCIASMALWTAETCKMAGWSAQTVDDVVLVGGELYAVSVEQMVRRDQGALADGARPLRPAEISRHFRASGDGQPEIEFTVVAGVSVGTLPMEQSVDGGLVADVRAFFANSSSAMLSIGDESWAVWHCARDDVYYVFDGQPRDEFGRTLLVNVGRFAPKAGMLGAACVQRFERLADLVQSILNNLRLRRDQMPMPYSLSRIGMKTRPEPGQTAVKKKALSKYRKFGSMDGADILRGVGGQQEGNHQLFGLRAGKQTLCNLLTALCWSRLAVSADAWTPADLAEILRQGDRMYVAQTVSQGPNVLDDFRVLWEHIIEEGAVEVGKVEKGTIRIGSTRFVIEVRREPQSPMVNPDLVDELLVEEEANVEGDNEFADDDDEADVVEPSEDKIVDEGTGDEGSADITEADVAAKSAEEVEETLPDLKTLLTKWAADAEENGTEKLAVIDSAVVQLALWQQNRMFYLYDPKANDASAMPTLKRRQGWNKLINAMKVLSSPVEPPNTHATEGDEAENVAKARVPAAVTDADADNTDEPASVTCYVLRFASIDCVINHLLAIIPEPLHKFQPIEFVHLNISIEPLTPTASDADTYYNFTAASHAAGDKVWHLRASMSQNDRIFPNRNRQAAANCIVCACMATVLDRDRPAAWTSALLDVILQYGDRLNTKSMQSNRVHGPSSAEQLTLHQICTPFVLAAKRFTVQVQQCGFADLTIVHHLADVLAAFFQRTAGDAAIYAVLYTNGHYVAAWSATGSYFLFVPHAPECGGVAKLLRCITVDAIAAAVLNANAEPPACSAVQLFSVRVAHTPVPAPKRRPSPMAVHSAYTQNASGKQHQLLGTISEGSAQLAHYRPAPSGCHAVAALATSLDQSADYWTPSTVDQILRLGCELSDLLDGLGEDDGDRCDGKLRPQRLCTQFRMHGGRVAVHVQLGRKLRGAVFPPPASAETSLKSALWRLLAADAVRSLHAVLTMRFGTLALWKEHGHLFVFSGKPLGGVVAVPCVACVYRCETVHELFATIVPNEMTVSGADLGNFEIRLCDFTLHAVSDAVLVAGQKKRRRAKQQQRKPESTYRRWSPECSVLQSTVPSETLLANQSAAIGLCAVAMSCVLNIADWSDGTLNTVQLAGGQLYADAQRLLDGGVSAIRLQHLPRAICIGRVRLTLSVSPPQRVAADDEGQRLCAEFVEQQQLSYVEATGETGAYVMLVHPSGSKFYYVVDATAERPPAGPHGVALCVWRFECVSGMWTHLTKGGGCELTMGAIECVQAEDGKTDQ